MVVGLCPGIQNEEVIEITLLVSLGLQLTFYGVKSGEAC